MHQSPRSRMISPSRLAASAVLGAAVMFGGAGSASASDGCGPNSTTFDGVRLLNNGVDNTAGPFSIDLAAGTYDVTLMSWDDHASHGSNPQPEQQNEQWYFVLDSGYESPPTVDVPTEENTSTTVIEAQEIDASTEITLHHLGESNVNSVDPICVGFALVNTTPVPENEPNDPQTPPREVVEVPEVSDVPEEAEEPVESEAVERDPEPETIDTEVQGITELPSTTSEIPPPLSIVKVPPAAVASVQASQAPVLAITGPSQAATGALLGGLLVALGSVLTGAAGARRQLARND